MTGAFLAAVEVFLVVLDATLVLFALGFAAGFCRRARDGGSQSARPLFGASTSDLDPTRRTLAPRGVFLAAGFLAAVAFLAPGATFSLPAAVFGWGASLTLPEIPLGSAKKPLSDPFLIDCAMSESNDAFSVILYVFDTYL